MLPAGPLMIEHRLIERMVAAIGSEARGIEGGRKPDVPFILTAVDFFRTYADRCHHGKEEDILFAVLQRKKMAPEHQAAMDRLVEDHVRSRALTKRLKALADGNAEASDRNGEIKDILFQLSQLYPDHIRREDKEFFPAAMIYLDGDERASMLRDFDEFDRKLIHEKYRAVVEGVEKR